MKIKKTGNLQAALANSPFFVSLYELEAGLVQPNFNKE